MPSMTMNRPKSSSSVSLSSSLSTIFRGRAPFAFTQALTTPTRHSSMQLRPLRRLYTARRKGSSGAGRKETIISSSTVAIMR